MKTEQIQIKKDLYKQRIEEHTAKIIADIICFLGTYNFIPLIHYIKLQQYIRPELSFLELLSKISQIPIQNTDEILEFTILISVHIALLVSSYVLLLHMLGYSIIILSYLKALVKLNITTKENKTI